MTKPYINDAIIGNSHVLGCLTSTGELIRAFWPNIGYEQHIGKLVCGVFLPGQQNSTSWLEGWDWQHKQSYKGDTNILETVCTSAHRGMKVTQTDFALMDRDVLVRRLSIENIGCGNILPGIIIYSAGITSECNMRSVMFDFESDALIHYKHGHYVSISGSATAYQFQLGGNAYDSSVNSELRGFDSIGMMEDGAVSWKLEMLGPGAVIKFGTFICFSETLNGLKKLTASIRKTNTDDEEEKVAACWEEYLKRAKQIPTGDAEVNKLYKRSLLVLKLMSDERNGAILAAPEIDESFTKCGRYAYCWARDAGFITGALDAAGLHDIVKNFYKWAVRVQDENGCWHQRYYVDGNLAPSWGLQIDETGTVIWGMFKHYEATGDKEFLTDVWESVVKAVNFIMGFIDEETGLPAASFDLWEERYGEHAYSTAAVHGGVIAAVSIGRMLGADEKLLEEWSEFAKGIRDALLKHFWNGESGRFIRSVRVKLNPWGWEQSSNTAMIKVNPKGYYRDVTLTDNTIDVSLIGISVPFKVIPAEDIKMKATARAIEEVLSSPASGGIKRYANDNYMGGNPWILAALWVALYYIKLKDYNKSKMYFEWSVKCRTNLGLLPEQADRESGKPAWVVPLTWSHAMFVLVLAELKEAGVL